MADSSDCQRSRTIARDTVRRHLKSLPRRGGPGFLSLLALLFIGLKLTGHIDWSWVWVLSPLWFHVLFFLLVAAAVVAFMKKTGWKPSAKT